MKVGVLMGVIALSLVGCSMGGGATAVAPAEIPDGWSKHDVGSKMTMVLPPYLQTDTIPKDSILSMLADAGGGGGDTLMRTYIGPDTKGRDCMVMLMAVYGPAGSTNPEGAVNEVVDMMSGMGMSMTDVSTSKRKVELPIGPAWRGVITMTAGGQAVSTIVYAGVASGRYYQVQFTESGAGDVVLVEDDAIMQTVRFE